MFAVDHIDKINDDQPAQVSQAQLPGDFLSSFEIGLEGGFFHISLIGGPSGIDIDGDHGFCGIDDKVSAGFQIDTFLVDDADLIFKVISIENGVLILIKLDHFDVSGCDGLAIRPHLFEGVHIIHEDFFNLRREVIPQRADAEIAFLVNQCRSGDGFRPFLDLFPQP